MNEPTTAYTHEDVAAVSRYLVALVDSDIDEHQAALLAALEGNPYSRLVALAHLTAGLIVESPTPPDEAVSAVFDLAGRVGDSLAAEGEDEG